MSDTITVAMWAANYASQFDSADEWLTAVYEKIDGAAKDEADFLILPEWISVMWRGFAPKVSTALDAFNWQSDTALKLMPIIGQYAKSKNVSLIAGTTPFTQSDTLWTNRAMIYMADGRVTYQDKLNLTPTERSYPNSSNGSGIQLINYYDYKIAVVICLDIEIPSISAKLLESSVDLVLVASQTTHVSGYNRVFNCAKARAVELMCPVTVVGGIGTENINDEYETNYSGAAVYVPCETEFGNDGIMESVGPFGITQDNGDLIVVSSIPIQRCKELRLRGAEAWPGNNTNPNLTITGV